MFDEAAGELIVGGIYLRLFIQQPAWVRRLNHVRFVDMKVIFLGKLLLKEAELWLVYSNLTGEIRWNSLWIVVGRTHELEKLEKKFRSLKLQWSGI